MRSAVAWLNEWCDPDGDTEPYDPDAPQSWEIPDRRPARGPGSETSAPTPEDRRFGTAWADMWEAMMEEREVNTGDNKAGF